jgi:hypothetical protein
MPKVEALLTVYGTGRRSRATARVEACKLSLKPHVAAEIERLVAERFPEALDYSRVLEEAVGNMIQLSRTGSDRIRLEASKWLLELACAREELEN